MKTIVHLSVPLSLKDLRLHVLIIFSRNAFSYVLLQLLVSIPILLSLKACSGFFHCDIVNSERRQICFSYFGNAAFVDLKRRRRQKNQRDIESASAKGVNDVPRRHKEGASKGMQMFEGSAFLSPFFIS